MRNMYIIAVVIFLLDQASKYYVVHVIELPRQVLGNFMGRMEVFPPYLNLVMTWNRGINFGLLAGDKESTKWILIAIALMITGWVIWWMRRETRVLARISAGFLIGGALGNVVDRLVYGAVADFLNMSCCGFRNPYSYNVADIAIFVGAVGLILFTGEKRPRDATK